MKNCYFFKNSYVECSPVDTKQCAIFFHGFPGVQLNADLAEAFRETFGMDTFLIHHEGLNSSKGSFSFLQSIEKAIDLVKVHIIAELGYTNLTIFGNSWGGAVAVNVAKAVGPHVNRLVLAAPFAFLPSPNEAKDIAQYFASSQCPSLLDTMNFDQVIPDFMKIKLNFAPLEQAGKLNLAGSRIIVIQGLRDTTVQPEHTRSFLNRFQSRPIYVEIDQDHDFSIRNDFIKTVLSNVACSGGDYSI